LVTILTRLEKLAACPVDKIRFDVDGK